MGRRAIGFLTAILAALLPGAATATDFLYPQTGPLTSTYYSERSYGNHGALDIAGPNRSAVTAGRAGRVSFAGVRGGYGNLVVIDHEAGYQTYYAHLSSFAAGVGQSVGAGQTIGYEGSTGNSTGPHVHFEVRRYGTKQYVPGNRGEQVRQGAGLPFTYADLGAARTSSNGQGSAAGTVAARVTAGVLNVRSGPGTGYALIGQVLSGQVYVADREEGGWYRVFFDGRQGWTHGGYLAGAFGVEGRRVTASTLNVRAGPGTGYAVVTVVPGGQTYVRAGASGDWIQIFFGGGTRWLHGGYTAAVGY